MDKKPVDDEGWRPWIGGTWSKWVKGKVMEYRDFAGREAQVRLVSLRSWLGADMVLCFAAGDV